MYYLFCSCFKIFFLWDQELSQNQSFQLFRSRIKGLFPVGMLSEHTKTDAVLAAPPVPTFDKPFCRFCPSGTSSNLVLIIFSYFDKIWNWQAQLSSVIAIT